MSSRSAARITEQSDVFFLYMLALNRLISIQRLRSRQAVKTRAGILFGDIVTV